MLDLDEETLSALGYGEADTFSVASALEARRRHARRNQSEAAVKEAQKRYARTAKGRATARRASARYVRTEKGRAAHRKAALAYYHRAGAAKRRAKAGK